MYKETTESAVSEIVGVILMVALTVIMAAIIATQALGMIEKIPESPTVIVTVQQSPDVSHIFVTYRGGPDHPRLVSLTIKWPDGTEELWPSPALGAVYTAGNIGAGMKNVTGGNDRIMVIGHFQNNKDYIMLDTMV